MQGRAGEGGEGREGFLLCGCRTLGALVVDFKGAWSLQRERVSHDMSLYSGVNEVTGSIQTPHWHNFSLRQTQASQALGKPA